VLPDGGVDVEAMACLFEGKILGARTRGHDDFEVIEDLELNDSEFRTSRITDWRAADAARYAVDCCS
jgi:hypothetical protein